MAARAGLYRLSSNDDVFVQVSVRDGNLIGHNFYSDDTDFALMPVAANRVVFRSGTLEFVPAAAGVPKQWQVLDSTGRKLAALQSSVFALSTDDLRSLAGDYRSQELDVTYTLTERDSALVIHPPGRADILLRPFAKDIFAGPSVGAVKFLRDARGAVSSFTATRDNARGVSFARLNRGR
jgi:hypothetical protein